MVWRGLKELRTENHLISMGAFAINTSPV